MQRLGTLYRGREGMGTWVGHRAGQRLARGLQPGDRHLPDAVRGRPGNRTGGAGDLPCAERRAGDPFRLLVQGRGQAAPDALRAGGPVRGAGGPAGDRDRRQGPAGGIRVGIEATPRSLPRAGAGEGRQSGRRGYFELYAWVFIRVSGVLLVLLVLGHFAMLTLALLHGGNGLRVIIDDYARSGARRLAYQALNLTVIGLTWVLGSLTIFIFTRNG